MILHENHEDVVEVRHAARHRPFVRRRHGAPTPPFRGRRRVTRSFCPIHRHSPRVGPRARGRSSAEPGAPSDRSGSDAPRGRARLRRACDDAARLARHGDPVAVFAAVSSTCGALPPPARETSFASCRDRHLHEHFQRIFLYALAIGRAPPPDGSARRVPPALRTGRLARGRDVARADTRDAAPDTPEARIPAFSLAERRLAGRRTPCTRGVLGG